MIVRRTGSLACVGALCLSLPAAAEAPEPTAAPLHVTLAYEAGPGCPDAAELEAVVAGRLGYDPFVESAPDHVRVRIAPRGNALDGRIEWRDAGGNWAGEQTFPSATTNCPSLARAMAFALSVQIQLLAKTKQASRGSGATADDTRPSPAPGAATAAKPAAAAVPSEVPPTVPGVASASPPSPSDTSSRPDFAMGAGPAAGFGMASAPVPLGRLFGAVTWPRASLELAAEVSLPATTRRPDGAGFSQQHFFLAVAACAGGAQWKACALARGGEIRMAGEDVDRPTSAEVPVLEAGARVGYVKRVGSRAFVGAHADGLARLVRWTATLDKLPVWTAPRFAAILALDAGVRFP